MAQTQCGSSIFDYQDDFTGKVKITTAEGSSVAVPCEDILKWASLYARQSRMLRADQMAWQDVLSGKG
jgi:hypothetical protein